MFFLCLKRAEIFKNEENILPDRVKVEKKSCRGIQQVLDSEAGRRKKKPFLFENDSKNARAVLTKPKHKIGKPLLSLGVNKMFMRLIYFKVQIF